MVVICFNAFVAFNLLLFAFVLLFVFVLLSIVLFNNILSIVIVIGSGMGILAIILVIQYIPLKLIKVHCLFILIVLGIVT